MRRALILFSCLAFLNAGCATQSLAGTEPPATATTPSDAQAAEPEAGTGGLFPGWNFANFCGGYMMLMGPLVVLTSGLGQGFSGPAPTREEQQWRIIGGSLGFVLGWCINHWLGAKEEAKASVTPQAGGIKGAVEFRY